MKIMNIRQVRTELSGAIRQAQETPICVTNHGRPVAVLMGVQGRDLEKVLLESDKDFWREIDRRTLEGRGTGVSIEDYRAGKRSYAGKAPRPRRSKPARSRT